MRRELHERFMPDRVWSDNKINPRSITFLSTELSTAPAARRGAENHGTACFWRSIAAEIPLQRARVWKTIMFDHGVIGN
jgi:hypothetical protein